MVVLYLHSTSNHNTPRDLLIRKLLYYIFILHQTTTLAEEDGRADMLYYIFILHQTTTYTTYIADIQPFENHIGRYEVV